MEQRKATIGTNGRTRQLNTTKKAETSAVAKQPTETTLVSAWLSTGNGFEPEKYLEKISELSKQPIEEILGERRYPRLIKPRRLYWACLRHVGKWSYPEIGESVGRDHSTVMHGINQVPHQVVLELQQLVEG